jgi:hypothetical protein
MYNHYKWWTFWWWPIIDGPFYKLHDKYCEDSQEDT